MSDVVIKVEDVGKLYRLGQIGTGTLSHDLNRWFARMRGKEDPFAKIGETNDRTAKGSSDYVWALKNVNFEVKQGEVLGIIGRNGAGKSTLLKILSKVTTPSTGSIKVKGRIASLLEVGTGFHPELTGRENIFLNGAILGMTKAEIKKKFDEIVDFAGVERYIDTPVKRYSSGMYVRLAFAVAAFLEPEILIVDEVLAVGDAEFQKKCIGRMQDVSKNDGRTVLFVSHNMDAITNLCQNSILLKYGGVEFIGSSYDTIDYYIKENLDIEAKANWKAIDPVQSGLQLTSVSTKSLIKIEKGYLLTLNLEYFHFSFHNDAFIAIDILNAMGVPIMQALPTFEKLVRYKKSPTNIEVDIELPPLIPGTYYVSFWAGSHNNETLSMEKELISFDILESPTVGRTFPHTNDHGFIVPFSNATVI